MAKKSLTTIFFLIQSSQTCQLFDNEDFVVANCHVNLNSNQKYLIMYKMPVCLCTYMEKVKIEIEIVGLGKSLKRSR